MSNGSDGGVMFQGAGVPTTSAAALLLTARGRPPANVQPRPVGFLDRMTAFVQSPEGKLTLGILGALGVSALATVAVSKSEAARPPVPPRPRRSAVDDILAQIKARPIEPEPQLAVNRRAGARYEEAVMPVLEEVFAGKVVLSQVTVATADGRKRRADGVVFHENGAAAAFEMKNKAVVTERDIQQAEEHREGLRHTFGGRVGKTFLVVPEGTVVKPEHRARVRVRTFTP